MLTEEEHEDVSSVSAALLLGVPVPATEIRSLLRIIHRITSPAPAAGTGELLDADDLAAMDTNRPDNFPAPATTLEPATVGTREEQISAMFDVLKVALQHSLGNSGSHFAAVSLYENGFGLRQPPASAQTVAPTLGCKICGATVTDYNNAGELLKDGSAFNFQGNGGRRAKAPSTPQMVTTKDEETISAAYERGYRDGSQAAVRDWA